MENSNVDLHLFVLNSNECFRKVVDKKGKVIKCYCLIPLISAILKLNVATNILFSFCFMTF